MIFINIYIYIYIFTPIEGITLGVGQEVDDVVGPTSDMDMDGASNIVNRASEGQAAGVYGIGLEWQGQEPGMGYEGQGSRLVLTS